ncbi:MAG: penicillin acylase family protein, partial [Caldilineaceae bacterium]|nr:penicillin acylase family protein [Caldilineaceae bacterium]
AQAAADVLERWDRSFDAESVGSVLFTFWAMALEPSILGPGRFPEDAYAVPPDPSQPFDTPMGLADARLASSGLEFAARVVPQVFGTLEAPWGAFVHFRAGDHELPAFGQGWGPFGFGSITPNLAIPQEDGALVTMYGDTWVAVMEFSDPVRVMAVMPYGNATQPGSSHVGDQLSLYVAKEYRPVWYARPEIEANLELHETLTR